MRHYVIPFVLVFTAVLAACGGRSAPSQWWTFTNQNNNNVIPPNCGDGVLDPDEQCDNGAANSDTRPDACRRNCRQAACGDGVRDSDEGCDQSDLGDEDCFTLGFEGGTLGCTAQCGLDSSQCTLCGDGLCTGDEWQWCPWDCEALCGNGLCEPGESPDSCPEDCRGECGDGLCEPGEQESCPWDCETLCGNGICEEGEEGWCEDCGGWCGDGFCSPDEQGWCEDCGGWCGDGICSPGEEGWCEDCGWCGNGMCEPGEEQWCPEDCGGWCGNGVCEPGEEPWCPEDCATVTTLACQGIALCILCCGNDATCRTACRQAGSQTARAEYNQFRTCAVNACPGVCNNGMSYSCLLCAYGSCQGMCHYGTAGGQGCNSVVSCASNCPSINTGGNAQTCPADAGLQCQSSCWAQGDAQSGTLYESWIGCIATQCGALCGPNGDPNQCQQCQSQSCATQAGACLAD